VVNAAAYTAVDRAESEPQRAMAVNIEAVDLLAQEMKRHNGWLVHYSTDYVFDGTQAAPYAETDAPHPQSVYGRSKLAGEEAIRASGCRHLIFRTSWVYSVRGGNFAKTMLRLAAERSELKVVCDQVGAPTGADLIADATALALHRIAADPEVAARTRGVFHLAAAGSTSWHGYAQLLIQSALGAGMPPRTTPDRVLPIASADYPVPAARPANSRLDTSRVCATFGLTLPPWQSGVIRLVSELAAQSQ